MTLYECPIPATYFMTEQVKEDGIHLNKFQQERNTPSSKCNTFLEFHLQRDVRDVLLMKKVIRIADCRDT